MKLKNGQMLTFMNKYGDILNKRIPRKLYSALYQNRSAMISAAEVYNTQYDDAVKEGAEAVTELLNVESEFVIQTVEESVFNLLDSSDKYDSLTGREYEAIEFMIVPDPE